MVTGIIVTFMVLVMVGIVWLSFYMKRKSIPAPSPYRCDGCGHHESYHTEDEVVRGSSSNRKKRGCHKEVGAYAECGCMKFISQQPEMYAALKEMNG